MNDIIVSLIFSLVVTLIIVGVLFRIFNKPKSQGLPGTEYVPAPTQRRANMAVIIFLGGLGVAIVLWLLGVFSGWWIVGVLFVIGWIFHVMTKDESNNDNDNDNGGGPPGGGGSGKKKLPLPVKMGAAAVGGYAIGKWMAKV